MFNNMQYPWYLQHDGNIKTIYEGLFPIVSNASPLGIENIFNVDELSGTGLMYFSRMWGLRGQWVSTTDALVYNISQWSAGKLWSGESDDANSQNYRQFIKMKAYINGKNYTLGLIKEAIAILLDGYDYTITVTEEQMHFTINITASNEALAVLFNLEKYDSQFLGKPSGISYDFSYTQV